MLSIFCGAAIVRAAAEPTPNPRDTLVFKDGDRVQGHLVERAGGTIVFKSDRFGELRVPATDVAVIPAEKPVHTVGEKPVVHVEAKGIHPPVAEEKKVARERAEEERVSMWDRFWPGLLTARVRSFFGPWHGKLAFSAEDFSDVADRNDYTVEAKLQRKWEHDEVQLSSRYEYAETNDLSTTDLLKGSGSWRHDFTKTQFMQYRPSVEWNRVSKYLGVPNDYVLLQQEIGVGYNLYTRPARKVRLGVSQNLFDVWNSAPLADHTSRGVQSVFEETEFKLPWQMGLNQRGVWYPVRGQQDGWENQIELNKKLTETLSAAVRHEIRRHNPDGSAQDYTRLRLLFGLDF